MLNCNVSIACPPNPVFSWISRLRNKPSEVLELGFRSSRAGFTEFYKHLATLKAPNHVVIFFRKEVLGEMYFALIRMFDDVKFQRSVQYLTINMHFEVKT